MPVSSTVSNVLKRSFSELCVSSSFLDSIFSSSSSALSSLPGVDNSRNFLLFPSAGLEPGPLNVKREQFTDLATGFFAQVQH